MSQFFVNSAGAAPPVTVVETLTANDASVATAAANNINVLGNNTANNGFATYTANATGSNFHLYSYGPYKWIVNKIAGVGTHQTIQAAYNTAANGDSIFICADPTPYVETLTFSSTKSVTFVGSSQGDGYYSSTVLQVIITHSGSGEIQFNNFEFVTNGNFIYSMTGVNACELTLQNCLLRMTNFSAISVANTSASSRVNLIDCQDFIQFAGAILFNCSFNSTQVNGNLRIFNHNEINTVFSTTPSVMVSGFMECKNSYFEHPITIGVNAQLEWETTEINLTTDPSANAICLLMSAGSSAAFDQSCTFCRFRSGTASAINVGATGNLKLNQCEVVSSNTNAITGSGQINISNVSFTGSSSLVNTTTQTPQVTFNDAVEVVRPAAYPYTVKAQDQVISVDTSSASNTVNLPASPVNGQKHTVKDRSANAAAQNITVSGNGHNIVGTTSAASQTISLNGASVTYVYDGVGTIWLAI